jgi:hypothetical protein
MQIVKPDAITTTGSVTRTGIATYYDSNGVLQTTSNGALRFGYNPNSLEFTGLIVENSSTNTIVQSSLFSDASWTNSNVSYTTGLTSPAGTSTATKVIPTTNNSTHYIRTTAVALPNVSTKYTASVFVKASGYSIVRVALGSDFYFFNLSTGNVGIKSSGSTPVVEKLTNGFYRLGISTTATSTSAILLVVNICTQEAIVLYQGDGTSGIIFYGAQCEASPIMTSYIATSGAAASRSAEVITGSGLLYTNVTNPYSEWSSGTTYSLGQTVVVGTYTGSNTVTVANSGTYKSLTNSNLNNNPLTSPTNWVRLGPTNQFAMFDNVVSSVTSGTSDITFVIKSTSVDSVAVLNAVASKVSCAVADHSYSGSYLGNVAYYRTEQLSGSEALDWYSYFFFDEETQKTQALYLSIPKVSDGIITVKITGSGTVSAGSIIAGQIKEIGQTQYGVNTGIIDYSRKETDEFGNTSLVVRNYSKRMNAKVFLTNSNLNRVQRLLYSIRATPVLWIGSTDPTFEEPLVVMGYYKDFDTEIAYPAHSLCNITVDGLI